MSKSTREERDLDNNNSEELNVKKIRLNSLSNEELLIAAAKEGNIEQVRFLIKQGADVNFVGSITQATATPSWVYPSFGEDGTSTTVIQETGVNFVNKTIPATALHIATKEGHREVVEELLACGANIEALADKIFTPLHYAVKYGRSEIVKILLEWSVKNNIEGYVHGKRSDASCSLQIYEALPPLHSVGGNIDIAKILLQYNADINLNFREYGTALHTAARFNEYRMVKFLLASKADIEALDEEGQTPLQEAAESGNNESLIILLEHDADVNTQDICSKTPLHIAAQNDKAMAMNILIAYGADIEARDDAEQTPLHYAINESPASIKALFKAGADFNATDESKATPWQYWLEYNNATTIANTMIQWIAEAHTTSPIKFSMNNINKFFALGINSLLKSDLPDDLKGSAQETLAAKLHDFYMNDITKNAFPELGGDLGSSVIRHYVYNLFEAVQKNIEYNKAAASNKDGTPPTPAPRHIKSLSILSLEKILPQMKELVLAKRVEHHQESITHTSTAPASEITTTEDSSNQVEIMGNDEAQVL